MLHEESTVSDDEAYELAVEITAELIESEESFSTGSKASGGEADPSSNSEAFTTKEDKISFLKKAELFSKKIRAKNAMARARSEVKQIRILNKQLKKQVGSKSRNVPILGIMKKEEMKLRRVAEEKEKAAMKAEKDFRENMKDLTMELGTAASTFGPKITTYDAAADEAHLEEEEVSTCEEEAAGGEVENEPNDETEDRVGEDVGEKEVEEVTELEEVEEIDEDVKEIGKGEDAVNNDNDDGYSTLKSTTTATNTSPKSEQSLTGFIIPPRESPTELLLEVLGSSSKNSNQTKTVSQNILEQQSFYRPTQNSLRYSPKNGSSKPDKGSEKLAGTKKLKSHNSAGPKKKSSKLQKRTKPSPQSISLSALEATLKKESDNIRLARLERGRQWMLKQRASRREEMLLTEKERRKAQLKKQANLKELENEVFHAVLRGLKRSESDGKVSEQVAVASSANAEKGEKKDTKEAPTGKLSEEEKTRATKLFEKLEHLTCNIEAVSQSVERSIDNASKISSRRAQNFFHGHRRKAPRVKIVKRPKKNQV